MTDPMNTTLAPVRDYQQDMARVCNAVAAAMYRLGIGSNLPPNAVRDLGRAALSAMAEVTTWQPMATAPQDGTRVLAWITPRRDRPGSLPSICDMAYDPHSGWSATDLAQPVYWMPLPDPPASCDERPKGQDAVERLEAKPASAVRP